MHIFIFGNNTFGNRKNASENREAVLFDHLVHSTLRDLLSTRFRPLDSILRAISSRKIRGEKRSRKRSNWVNCSRQDSSSSSSSSSSREREREREKGSKHGRDVFRKTNEISFHERGRHRRKRMDPVVRYKVYRACIYKRLWSLQFERTREPATIKFPSKV